MKYRGPDLEVCVIDPAVQLVEQLGRYRALPQEIVHPARSIPGDCVEILTYRWKELFDVAERMSCLLVGAPRETK